MRLLSLTLSAVMFLSGTAYSEVVMCYYESWAYFRPGNGKFEVEDIDPTICTHLMYAFAILDPDTNMVIPGDPEYDIDENAFARFNALKEQNDQLKTILSVGGWGDGSMKYSEMASTAAGRQAFVDSSMALLLEHGFDGLDIDWEYPGGRPGEEEGLPNDKENYGLLLRELRAACDTHGFLLTAAVGAGGTVIDTGYDISVMAELLDYIGVMSYDYHGWWGGHDFTGHHSPLGAIPEEADPDHPGHNANTKWSIQRFIDGGARREQLLVGLGGYGRGFLLADPDRFGLYDAAVGPLPAERYTNESGYWGYNEFCERLYEDGEMDMWSVVVDENVAAPYAHNGDLWFGYDDPASVTRKCEYVLSEGLGGAMIWAIDTDDFRGVSGQAYPLVNAMANTLNGGGKRKKQ